MAEQAPQLWPTQGLDLAAQTLGGALRKMLVQQRNIFATFTQWRQAQLRDVEPIGQVFAKAPGTGFFQQVGLGGSDDAQVHLDTLVGAQPLQLLFLQYAQQFHLLGQGHAFDFIQEQGAAVGIFQFADAFAVGAGEGAAFMSEEFGFEQLLGDCRAIEGHERLLCAWAEVVQAAGDQLLAAAGFTANQHIDRQTRQVQHLAAQALKALGHTQQAGLQLRAMIGLLMQPAVFQDQATLVQRPAQAVEQGVGAEGFFQEVVGAVAHGFDGHWHVAMAGEQNHRQIGIAALHLGQQFKAAEPWHAHVAQNHPGKVLGQLRQALFGAAEQLHVKPRQAQPLLDGRANTGFVIDHNHRVQHRSGVSRAIGRVKVKVAPSPRLAALRRPPSSCTIA
ncbi:hypothetical protein ALP29_05253 [Pseudomonas syringae pv. avii]|uniref:Uncharacterized protein n=1 Tax=Pseudomonas syringae pv. avii TaxID=663959 RepID=A0A3M5UKD9_PSESX|nr:hypothetical protein ALP29_05253 [Pseudomonas syringae pv. avii]